jgi:hypothetical protein
MIDDIRVEASGPVSGSLFMAKCYANHNLQIEPYAKILILSPGSGVVDRL